MNKHENNHEKVYLVCAGYSECKHKTMTMVDTIKMFLIEDYSLEDWQLPSTFCSMCYHCVCQFQKGDFLKPPPEFFD